MFSRTFSACLKTLPAYQCGTTSDTAEFTLHPRQVLTNYLREASYGIMLCEH
ncbi:Protein of unknown function [Pyronema omphalodes CBS 100304]|uniref:Uncharacterized protein n=1 Tax=Pyronema omphalodes (strain CBS 100304) TaxID=1076935 RepID=U4LI04_PYROM|nr:Protein of unknown function [Pyronema omphalodes CBS 100304]